MYYSHFFQKLTRFKKESFILGGLLSVFFPSIALSTGIDWETSFIKVEFTKENENTPAFSCFGFSDRSAEEGACLSYSGPEENCVWQSLETLGFSDETPSPEIPDCFQQAGNYKTTLQLFDFAQNPATPNISNFVIFPGPPDPDASVFLPSENCDDGTLTANGEDVCTILFKVRDEFGNPVTQLKNATGEIYSDTVFINDANSGDLGFRDGLRLDDEIIPFSTDTPLTFSLSNDNEVQYQFTFKSWAPSTEQVGPYLGRNIPFVLDFSLELPTINSDGTINLSESVTFEFDKYSPSLQFRPWLRTLLGFVNEPEFIINIPTPMKIIRNLLLPTNKGSDVSTTLFMYNLPENMEMIDFPLSPEITSLNNQETFINPTLTLDYGEVPGFALGFSTVARYTINDGTGDKLIKYPSGAIGNDIPDGDGADDYNQINMLVSILGASIEGLLMGDEETTLIQDAKTIFLGQAQLEDTRQKIFQNAFKISRGIVPKTDINPIQFQASWFDDEDVVLVKDQDVTIGNSGSLLYLPDGKNTLIIQNGNLIIDGDFAYQNKLDSFGFILINDQVQEAPENGNIFIRTDVKNFAGTYFAEGGLMSNDSILPTPLNNNNGLGNDTQLLLEGTLLTHNTLGGAQLNVLGRDYLTPWKETTDRAEAAIYDLHLVRQFYPIYDEFEPYAQNNTEYCFSDPCDANRSSFVIRMDGRATKLPPPGFELFNTLSR